MKTKSFDVYLKMHLSKKEIDEIKQQVLLEVQTLQSNQNIRKRSKQVSSKLTQAWIMRHRYANDMSLISLYDWLIMPIFS